MEFKTELKKMCVAAKAAAQFLAQVSSQTKNKVLTDMGRALEKNTKTLLAANKKDIVQATKSGLSKAFLDRLTLNEKRISEMSGSLCELTKLPDPVGEVVKAWRRPNGLWIHKVRTPIGVIAIIYEARPNVTSDCIGLCFKSGNSVMLKGGSDSFHSNSLICSLLKNVLGDYSFPEGIVQLVNTRQHKDLDVLLSMHEYIDLVIPRGGESLITRVTASSRIPVIKHYKGICHVYIDEWADLNMAQNICYNAKVQRPGVCNAMESMLVHLDVAQRFLPGMAKAFAAAGVELRGCPITRKIIKDAKPATEKDYRTEYLALILSIKVVKNMQEAIEHINAYGSHHSDTIVTENYENALAFLQQVDSACVYVNASTRFTDGYQFGLGAEIGISTDKLHARGPMGLEELTTYKYMVFGNGQVRT